MSQHTAEKRQVHYHYDPLLQIQWRGLHLIEASAGTGKTWTLSSLMVRIFCEKYWPQQVIATTFTRAAAAELKERIRLRLQDMYQLALSWQHEQADIAQLKHDLHGQVLESYLFQQFYLQGSGQDNLYLINRLRIVLDTLDELFVGTIDSFVQKILKEFAFESGATLKSNMTERADELIYQLVHDGFRQWIQQQPTELIERLYFEGILKTPDDYLDKVKKVLNFQKAVLLEPEIKHVDALADFNATLSKLLALNPMQDQALAEFYRLDGEFIQHVHGTSFKPAEFNAIFAEGLAHLLTEIAEGKGYVDLNLATLNQIENLFFTKSKTLRKQYFKGKQAKELEKQFFALPVIGVLAQLIQQRQAIQQYFKSYDQYICYYLCQYTKQHLPQLLAQLGETTFNRQTQRLHEALHGEQGAVLAGAIAQRYPLILVDEFQDTNQEQDDILRIIWRQQAGATCFIAVGDPKQAIYGFRGGDILTYFNAFNDIADKQGQFYRLVKNFRSTPALVQVVDALFQRQPDFGEQVSYYPAEVGKEQSALLYEQERLTPALHGVIVPLEQQKQEADVIAAQIQHLLWQAEQGQLYFALPDQRERQAVSVNDIAVLAEKHRDLEAVQFALLKRRIAVQRISQENVLYSPMAQELLAVLLAIQQPERESVLKRGLFTPLIGVGFAELTAQQQRIDGIEQHIYAFRKARQLWLEQGLMVAWQWFAEHYQVWTQLAKNTGHFAERHIVNVQHLLQILTEASQQMTGIQHLLDWFQLKMNHAPQAERYMERPLSADTGVQLMTIHGSKGLEFKIVFLMKADVPTKAVRENELVFFQDRQRHGQERVIAIHQSQVEHNPDAIQQNEEKAKAEEHRKWYVALTRASYRMYLILHEQQEKKEQSVLTGAAGFWLHTPTESPFQHQAYVEYRIDLSQLQQQNQQNQQHTQISPSQKSVPKLYAQPLPQTRFLPYTRTSFTALATHQTQVQSDVLVEQTELLQSAEDEQHQTMAIQQHGVIELNRDHKTAMQNETERVPIMWIAQAFAKGQQAGNCLHELLENIDFQHDEHWHDEILHHLHQYQLWGDLMLKYEQAHMTTRQTPIADLATTEQWKIKQQLSQQIQAWLTAIVRTPLNEQGICLQAIAPQQRFAELSFSMALAEQALPYQAITTLFHQHGIALAELQKAPTARFLNGAIDLVFFDGKKYHVADFKSNYLGEWQQDYQPDAVANNMLASSYWLQAGIYLVALHRYLAQCLPDYDIEHHLGDAYYLYLRGMSDQQHGVQAWRPDTAFILQLDALLGYPASGQLSAKAG